MSGESHNNDCPRCLGKGTLDVYTDWKPFDTASSECMRCGFTAYTKVEIISETELKGRREDYEHTTDSKLVFDKLTKEEKEHMELFDKRW